jgi:uncharacterized repeat protein (TIGR02543 family)
MSETYAWDVQVLAQYTLTLTIGLSGAGQIQVTGTDGSSYTCPTDCAHVHVNGTSVTLHAVAYSGYQFTGWGGTGGCTGTSDCTIVMSANRAVTANFSTLTGSIGTLDEVGSTWYHGPFSPGQTSQLIAHPHVGNVGYTLDTIHRKYVYKNASGTWVDITTFNGAIAVGAWAYYDDIITIPAGIQTCAVGSQCVRFGLKVWGTGETEPANPTLSWDYAIDPNLLIGIGIVGAAGIIGLLWYTKKKKIW